MLNNHMDKAVREKEREFFEAERHRASQLFERDPMIDSPEFLKEIGIEIFNGKLPLGYLRLVPQDFIVEEIAADGTIHTVDAEASAVLSSEGKTVYADLVKVGISTLEAQAQIAEALSIPPQSIGFAGIKDRLALTSQAISLRDVKEANVSLVKVDNFFLKNMRMGKGAIANGDLQGNRFTIVLRLQSPLLKEEVSRIEKTLEQIKEDGFWNFFSFQRFGTPRLLSHRLGLLLIRGEFEKAVHMFIVHQSPRELPYFQHIRAEIEKQWGNWKVIQALLEPFPSHFPIELTFVRRLMQNATDFLGALCTMPDQVRLWIYAYDSYLFNKKLSRLIKEGEVPLELPLLTSFSPLDWEPYKEFLEQDSVKTPSAYYKKFPFIRVASRTWPVLQKTEIHAVAFQDKFALFSFSLPKGAYATTLLMNFFTLVSGLPVIAGITNERIDAKASLGLGSLQSTLERFKTVLDARDQDLVKEFE